MAAIIIRQQRIARIAAQGITTLRVLVDRSLASAGGPGAGVVVTVPVTVETASILLPQITLYETATAPDAVTQGAIYSAQLLDLNGFVVSEVPGFGAFTIRIPSAETTWNELRESNDFQALIQSAVTNRLGLDTTPTIGQSVITVIGGASQAGLDTINLFFGSSVNPPGIRHNVATGQMEFSHNGLTWASFGGGGGGGSVTSVGLSLPAIFSVSGSPVTTTGTLTGTLVNQSANTFFAGPSSGGAAVPAFRLLVANDYPTMIGDSGAGGTKGAVPAPAAGDAAANKFLKADGVWTVIPSAPVTSVFGRTGAVVAQNGDYSFSQISGTVADGQLSANVTLLGNSTTGTGAIVRATSPTIVTPTIASFVNANHTHADAAGGGQLNATNIFNAGTVPVARLPLLVGDAGAGGVAGLAPAPAAGDAAANKFLKADGTWSAVPGGSSGANPTASLGLAAINGVATTFMRSDAAPALDQGITPTWTGAHAFSNTIAQSSPSATAFRSGANAATPSFQVDNSTPSQASGIKITGKADGTAPELLSISRTQTASALAGNGLSITADPAIAGNTNAGAAAGGAVNITGGAAARLTSGNANGGDVNLAGGAPVGTGIYGSVWIRKPNLTGLDSYAPLKMRNPFNDSSSRFISFYGPNDTTEQGFISTNAGNTGVIFSGTQGNFSNDARIAYTTINGTFISSTNLSMGSGVLFGWTADFPYNAKDLILRRSATGHLTQGAADAAPASVVAQTFGVQNVVAGTTNGDGKPWTLRGSLGTSQGVPGRLHFQTGALIAASGTTQQTPVDREIFGASKVLTNNTVTTVCNVTVANNTVASGIVDYTVEVFDGTDVQIETGEFIYQVTNKDGTIANNTITPPTGYPKNVTTAGTLTVTWTISNANPALLQINANSSLTPSTGYPRVTYNLRNHAQQAVAIQ